MSECEFRRELRRAGVTVLRAWTAQGLSEREFWGEVRRAALTLVWAVGARYGFGTVRVEG